MKIAKARELVFLMIRIITSNIPIGKIDGAGTMECPARGL
jgi:hypothetical protein